MRLPPTIRRSLLLALGWICFGLGTVGVVLPVLPTTPFMLVALWAFSQSSERFHDWLYGHRLFGPPLQRWRRHRVIPVHAKVTAVAAMVASLTWVLLATDTPPLVIAVMVVTMAGGAGFILACPSRPPADDP